MESLNLRPRQETDAARIIAIHAELEPEGYPLSPDAAAIPDGWVAVLDGEVIGWARISPAWWTGAPDSYAIEIRVDPGASERGAGRALFDKVASELRGLKAGRVSAWVREDCPHSRGFARTRGFRETEHGYQDFRLHVPDADLTGLAEREAELRSQGLRFATLAELPQTEAFRRELQRLWSGGEEPDMDFAQWRADVLDGTGQSSETHWLALEAERPVGTTFLRMLGPEAAENDYTGVLPSHRNRGIAAVLKGHAIRWAQQNGVKWYYTASSVQNGPMIAVHHRLGYQAGPRRLEVVRDLKLEPDT